MIPPKGHLIGVIAAIIGIETDTFLLRKKGLWLLENGSRSVVIYVCRILKLVLIETTLSAEVSKVTEVDCLSRYEAGEILI